MQKPWYRLAINSYEETLRALRRTLNEPLSAEAKEIVLLAIARAEGWRDHDDD